MARDYQTLAAQLGITGHTREGEMYVKCPLHVDSSPSFALNIRTGLWVCHSGCGSGDFLKLVMRVLSFGMMEAEAWIQSNGERVTSDELHRQIEEMLRPEQAVIGHAPMTWIGHYAGLPMSPMPDWLFNRGFTWDSVIRWGIRWDEYHQAVVIPFYDDRSALVGTITRNLRSNLPKYVNSQNLPRTTNLFGLHLQRTGGTIIIVEGPLDAIWLDQLGYTTAALLGSSMSLQQAQLLQAHGFNEVILALDADKAGQDGIPKADEQLVRAGYLPSQIKRVTMPDGRKDFQECDDRLVGETLAVRQMLLLAA